MNKLILVLPTSVYFTGKHSGVKTDLLASIYLQQWFWLPESLRVISCFTDIPLCLPTHPFLDASMWHWRQKWWKCSTTSQFHPWAWWLCCYCRGQQPVPSYTDQLLVFPCTLDRLMRKEVKTAELWFENRCSPVNGFLNRKMNEDGVLFLKRAANSDQKRSHSLFSLLYGKIYDSVVYLSSSYVFNRPFSRRGHQSM